MVLSPPHQDEITHMRTIVLALSFIFFSFSAFAISEAATKKDAEAFVSQAVAYLAENGRERFFNEVRSSNGRFHFIEGTNKELYIFVYDTKGVVLAHGYRVGLNFRNRWNDKDGDGKYWIQDWTNLVNKSGSGWIAYKEYNPANGNKLMTKRSFVRKVDGLIIGCGIYSDTLLYNRD
jgi:cytochrome c